MSPQEVESIASIRAPAEHKVAKLIALVEELRRDLPMVKDRIDHEANAMQETVDPHAMLEALARAIESAPPKNNELP